jgi:outer membrane protein assembly factor BamB
MNKKYVFFLFFSLIIHVTTFTQDITPQWPMYGYDSSHTGRVSYKGPETLNLKWKYKLEGDRNWIFILYKSFSFPAIGEDGTIYVGSPDSKLYAINPDGTLKWKFKTKGAIIGTPIIDSKTIYIGSLDKKLYAISADGTLKWKYETEGGILTSPSISPYSQTVYIVSNDRYLYAINSYNGKLRWRYDMQDETLYSPAVGKNKTIYIGGKKGYLYAISDDGKLKWKYRTKGRIGGPPVINLSDETIYVTSLDRYLYAIKYNGKLKWKYKIDVAFGTPPIPAIGVDGTIYIGGGPLYAINPDGTLKWKFNTKDYILFAPTIDIDGIIYAAGVGLSNDVYLYAINPDGTLKWEYKIENDRILSSPTIDKNRNLYIVSAINNYLYAIGNVK